MIFDDDFWNKHYARLKGLACAWVKTSADADDIAAEVMLAFWQGQHSIKEKDEPEKFLQGIYKRKRADYFRKHGREVQTVHGSDDVNLVERLSGEIPSLDDGESEPMLRSSARYRHVMLVFNAAVHHVMQYGHRPDRGTTTLKAGKPSQFKLSSLEKLSSLVTRAISNAPVDPATRQRAHKDYVRLMLRAMKYCGVDYDDVDVQLEDTPRGSLVITDEQDGQRLSGAAEAAVELTRLLFPRLSDLEIIDHVLEQECAVYTDEASSVSKFLYEYKVDEDAAPDPWAPDSDLTELHRLWSWSRRPGNEEEEGALDIISDEGAGTLLAVSAREGDLLLEDLVGLDPEQGAEVTLDADQQQRLRGLGFEPPDEETPAWHLSSTPNNKNDLERVMNKISRVLVEVHGVHLDEADYHVEASYEVEA